MLTLLTDYSSNSMFEDNSTQIILDLSCIETPTEKPQKHIDITKASIEDLSSLIVKDMISSVKKDLAKIVSKSKK
ncbi:MAG: hypothetical protein HS119_02220 [Flavobacteriales bacterium]|nr:hypothetical protein [Flavobacteriales bacterium]MCL4856449.1 hypothetical protein [Flavobacteriales bacterium]